MAAEVPSFQDKGRCQERVARTRCIFKDGHPGLHVCVGSFGSQVAIRGDAPLPEDEWISPQPPLLESPGPSEAGSSEGRWNGYMRGRLLAEIREAGVGAPCDWIANLPRLRRREDDRSGGTSDAPTP